MVTGSIFDEARLVCAAMFKVRSIVSDPHAEVNALPTKPMQFCPVLAEYPRPSSRSEIYPRIVDNLPENPAQVLEMPQVHAHSSERGIAISAFYCYNRSVVQDPVTLWHSSQPQGGLVLAV